MTLVQWASSGSGDWLNANDWAGGVVPGAADNVQIEVAGVTVSVGSGTLAVTSLTTSASAFQVTGGTLTISGTTTLGGAFAESSGVLNLVGNTSMTGGASQTGGVLQEVNGLLSCGTTFTEAGGSLQLGGQGGSFAGAITDSSGTIALTGNTLVARQGLALSGGTLSLAGGNAALAGLTVSAGVLLQSRGLVTDSGTYSQTGGAVTLTGGGITFASAATLSAGLLEVAGGAQLISDQSYSQSGGTLLLASNAQQQFYGSAVQTGGLIFLANGSLQSNGSFVENGGSLSLGFGGGTFNALTLEAGNISSTAPVIQVNGAFNQTGGTISALGRGLTLAGGFSQAAGATIDILSGKLLLEGSGSLAGTVAGNGTLVVQSGTTTLASGMVMTLPAVTVLANAKLVVSTSMTITQALSLSGNNANLALGGHTLTVLGLASLGGEFGGAGTLIANGGGQIDNLSLDGTAVLDINSAMNQTGQMILGQATGSRADINIAAKTGHLNIAGNFATLDYSQNGLLTNAGYLAKTGGSGTATISTNVVSTGNVSVNIGTLAFAGPTDSFGGAIVGAGTFALAAGQVSFAKGLSLTVARVLLAVGNEQLTLANSQAYAGDYSQLGGTLWLRGAATTLTASSHVSLDGGLITGDGTLVATAASLVNLSGVDIEGTATLDVAGTVNQTSSVGLGAQLGAQSGVIIEAGAVWRMEGNGSLGGVPLDPPLDGGTVVNNGLLEKLNGSGTQNSNIVGTFANNGTLMVANSTLTLYGWGTLGGTLTGHGAIDLQGSYTLASNLALSVGKLGIGTGAAVSLTANLTDSHIFSQYDGTLLMGGNTLTLAGLSSLEGGTLSGPGSVLTTGSLTLGDSYAVSAGTLTVAGTADQIGDIVVGDFVPGVGMPGAGVLPPSTATLQITAGATYRLDDSVSIASNGTLAVAGTFSALGGGASTVGPSVIDTGTILANSAQLLFIGPVSGTGKLLVGSGLLDFRGSVAASNTVSFTTGTGSLLLENPASFAAGIAGFQSGDFIELGNISTNLGVDTLALNAAGTVATISDTSGDSYSLTFTTAQSSGALTLGTGSHGELALFHT